MTHPTSRASSQGALDGLVWATLDKPYDKVSAFNRALACHSVDESDRAEYDVAFDVAYKAECKTKRRHQEGRL